MTDFTIDGVLRADARGTGRHSVTFERTYPTVRDDLWQALTDPDRVARWFAPISGELRPGGTVTAHFDDGDATFEVTECTAPERVSFNWLHGGGAPSTVTAVLRSAGDQTALTLVHSGLEARQAPGYAAGWDVHLSTLAGGEGGEARTWDDFPGLHAAYAAALEGVGD